MSCLYMYYMSIKHIMNKYIDTVSRKVNHLRLKVRGSNNYTVCVSAFTMHVSRT